MIKIYGGNMLRFVFSGIAVALCWSAVSTGAAEPGERKPPVVVAPVKMLKETSPKRYVGSIETIKNVDVMPRITGNLLKVNFTEGSIVKEGDLLYELEDTTYRAAVDVLKAQKEQLEAALRYADVQFRRSQTLRASNAVAETSHDKAVLEIDSAKSKIKEISASLIDAENNLSYTRIHAPLTGRIGKSAWSAGNLITPQGGKLTDIVMTAPIYVRFSLSEKIFRRDFGGSAGIKEKAVIRVQLADGKVYNETAQITLIDNKINTTTNTITLWAIFANQDTQLIPGGFVTVLVSSKQDKPYAAIIPSALIADETGYFVYAVDAENKVIRKEVKAGDIAEGYQIILEGLDGSERVIIDGTHKARPGMTVTPTAPEAVR